MSWPASTHYKSGHPVSAELRAKLSSFWRGKPSRNPAGGLPKHGHAVGGRQTPEYKCWADMKTRCHNPNCKAFKNYGARGIKVCDRWLDFSLFFEDMGTRPEGTWIERIDNDGNYEPANCCWATPKEQRANQRRPSRSQGGQ